MRLLATTIAGVGMLCAIGIGSADARNWLVDKFVSAQAEAPAQYITAPVRRGRIAQTITATGSLQAVSTVKVSSQLSGQIADLAVDFNAHR